MSGNSDRLSFNVSPYSLELSNNWRGSYGGLET